jgi:hypothetical protein
MARGPALPRLRRRALRWVAALAACTGFRGDARLFAGIQMAGLLQLC